MNLIKINLSKTLNRNFKNLLNQATQIHPNFSYHNKLRLQFYPESKNTYDGSFCCGLMWYLTYNFLNIQIKNNNFKKLKLEVWKTTYGYGKYIEDHVHIRLNNIIIDPTYKQFFKDNRSNGNCPYYHYLYSDLEPFFVGTKKDLNNLSNLIENINIQTYGNLNIDIKERNNMWKKEENITNKIILTKLS